MSWPEYLRRAACIGVCSLLTIGTHWVEPFWPGAGFVGGALVMAAVDEWCATWRDLKERVQ